MQLAQRQTDGSTLREHLMAARAAGADADPRLDRAVPAHCAGLWRAFTDLGSARPSGFGASCVPPSEIVAWQALHGAQLSSWEVDTLMAMDRAVVGVQNEANNRKQSKRQ